MANLALSKVNKNRPPAGHETSVCVSIFQFGRAREGAGTLVPCAPVKPSAAAEMAKAAQGIGGDSNMMQELEDLTRLSSSTKGGGPVALSDPASERRPRQGDDEDDGPAARRGGGARIGWSSP